MNKALTTTKAIRARRVISRSATQTRKAAAALTRLCTGGEVIALLGGLGAGKTVFAKGIAAELGITDEVLSPTFTLLRQYSGGRLMLNHMDLYRVEGDEAGELGIEELINPSSLTVIEWADNAPDVLPSDYIRVEITVGEDGERVIDILPQGGDTK